MPVDASGQEIKVGDTVTIEATVVRILDTPDHQNMTVQTVCVCPPLGHVHEIHLNTKQVKKVAKPK